MQRKMDGDALPGRSNEYTNIVQRLQNDSFIDEMPERDIGPNISKAAILRDLRQMAADCRTTNLGNEMAQFNKLEDIFEMTDNPDVGITLRDVTQYKAKIKEKKTMFDQLMITNNNVRSKFKKKGVPAICEGKGDILEGLNENNIDQKLHNMEKRIIEAKRSMDSKGENTDIKEALHNYHEIFKESMGTMENIIRNRANSKQPKLTSLRKFIEETEKTLVYDGKGDADVTSALKELRHLNKYNTFSPNKLPYIPELPYDFEEEISGLNISYNDILDDLNVEDNIVEIPLTQFLKNSPKISSARTVIRQMERAEKNSRGLSHRRKTKSKTNKR